jgi:hypothetical protein
MIQDRISDKFKAFLNLNGSGAGTLDVRNIWGEYAPTPRFNVRVGKIYRFFGLYNEILDAVPTYFGIEPPELFDSDHLILSRTTNFMTWGELDAGKGRIRYSLTTDNGEGDPVLGTVPLGGDLRFTSGDDRHVVGTSFYFSNGETTPDIGVGEGSPKSGVLPWMASDRFKVFGGYGQVQSGAWTLQAEYWRAPHQSRRDPASVVEVVNNAEPNSTQLARFLVDPTQPATESNVAIEADYAVETWYLRKGYSFSSRIGRLEPYAQWDWYRNPETIANKTYGGDNEAGVTDDGTFDKATLGVVFRPVPAVAVKLDGSSHRYRFHGSRVHFRVIVNAANPASSLGAAELSRLFMKKTMSWPGGQRVAAVDQERTSSVRGAFSRAVHSKDPDAIVAHWQTMVFSGRDTPPAVKASDASVLEFVRSHPGAIGYVSEAADLAGVKLVAVR